VEERCSGRAPVCGADAKRSDVCRPPVGPCDLGERCDGVSNDCPPDRLAPPLTVCRSVAGACDVAERCSGTSALCPPEIVLQGECGDGCRNPGEECGEGGLGPCPEGTTCVGCRCVGCARAVLACQVPARDATDGEVDVVASTGSRPLGAYAFSLAWDASQLGLETIAGGASGPFVEAPRCEVDEATGVAACTAGQQSRSDGPTRSVHVARARLRRLDAAPRRPEVRVAFHSLTDTSGEPIPACVANASCRLPECRVHTDCEDGDECTHDQCVDGGCTREAPSGFVAADCQLRKLLTVPCDPSAVPTRLARTIPVRVERTRRLVDRAARARDRRAAERLLRRADRQLSDLQRRTQRSARLDARCRTTVTAAIAEQRRRLGALLP
jgi:hypothetical protein